MLGETELESGNANLKNMTTGTQTPITLGDGFVEQFSNISVSNMFSGVLEDFNI